MTPITIFGFGVSSTVVPFAATAVVGVALAGLLLATVAVLVVADLRRPS
jgi:hypothetical protein